MEALRRMVERWQARRFDCDSIPKRACSEEGVFQRLSSAELQEFPPLALAVQRECNGDTSVHAQPLSNFRRSSRAQSPFAWWPRQFAEELHKQIPEPIR